MKLSSDTSVFRLTHEGIANFACMSNFGKKSIQHLPNICKRRNPTIDTDYSNKIGAEAAVAGASMFSISVSRLITAANISKYYGYIARIINLHNKNYSEVLATFKIEHEACLSIKDEAKPKVPKINYRDDDHKITRWSPSFEDFLTR